MGPTTEYRRSISATTAAAYGSVLSRAELVRSYGGQIGVVPASVRRPADGGGRRTARREQGDLDLRHHHVNEVVELPGRAGGGRRRRCGLVVECPDRQVHDHLCHDARPRQASPSPPPHESRRSLTPGVSAALMTAVFLRMRPLRMRLSQRQTARTSRSNVQSASLSSRAKRMGEGPDLQRRLQ